MVQADSVCQGHMVRGVGGAFVPPSDTLLSP